MVGKKKRRIKKTQRHYGDVVVGRGTPSVSLRRKPDNIELLHSVLRTWWRRVWGWGVLAVGVVLVTVLIVGGSTLRARTVDLYATSCLGDWERPARAEGPPTRTQTEILTEANSALLAREGADLFCGDFVGEVPSETLPSQAVLHVRWSVDGVRRAGVTEIVNTNTSLSSADDQDAQAQSEVENETTQQSEEISQETEGSATTTEEVAATSTDEEVVQQATTTDEVVENEVTASSTDETSLEEPLEDTDTVDVSEEEEKEVQETNDKLDAVEEIIEEAEAVESTEIVPDTIARWFGVSSVFAQEEIPITSTTTHLTTEQEIEGSEQENTTTTPDVTEDDEIAKDSEVVRIQYTLDNKEWFTLGSLTPDMSGEVALPLPINTWNEIADLTVLVQGADGVTEDRQVFIDALWVSVDYDDEVTVLDSFAAREQNYIASLPRVVVADREIVRADEDVFGAHEEAVFVVNFATLPRSPKDVVQPTSTLLEIPQAPELPQVIILDEDEATSTTEEEPVTFIETPIATFEEVSFWDFFSWRPTFVFAQDTNEEESVEDTDVQDEVSTPAVVVPEEDEAAALDNPEEVVEPEIEEATADVITDEVAEEDVMETATNTVATTTDVTTTNKVTPTTPSHTAPRQESPDTAEEPLRVRGTRIVGATVIDPDHNRVTMVPAIETIDDLATLRLPQPERFLPGEYTLELEIMKDDVVYVTSDTFIWGVLALNMDRSVYLPTEEPLIQLAALDRKGHTICDADLTLEVRGPSDFVQIFMTQDGSLETSGQCGPNNVTDEPDYFVRLMDLDAPGQYSLRLSNTDTGVVVTDTFTVQAARAFDVVRQGATRINPFRSAYEMELEVTATEAGSVTIVEQVPLDFEITDHNAHHIEETDTHQLLVWEEQIDAGERERLRYTYQAPRVTPELFVLGPLVIRESTSILESLIGTEKDILFTENRQWQLASDAPGDDFRVIRGSTVIGAGNTTATITESTDYNLETGVTINDAFIRITNARLTGMGDTAGGGNQNLDDFTVVISDPENLLTSITFQRVGTVNPQRVEWEIIQYIGSVGGPNEMVVRAQESLSTNNTTANGSNVGTVSTTTRVAVFITGQGTNNTANTAWNAAQFTGDIGTVGMNNRAEFIRGVNTNTGVVSYAMVEFTGSNWRDITRDEFTSAAHNATVWTIAADTNSGTQTIGTALLDASKAFLHVQYRNSNAGTQGLDDSGENVELTNSTTTYTTRRRVNAGAANKTLVVWVIENTQSDAGAMKVEHVSFYDGDINSGTEETVVTQSITSVDAVNNTSIMGETASVDGGGTAYPRGSTNFRLTAANEVTWTESDDGQEKRQSFDVVQWPWEVTTPVTEQNHFRWRDDTTALNTSGGFLAAEDTNPTAIDRLTTYRLRIEAANTGAGTEVAARQYELQFADKGNNASCGVIASTTWAGIADSGTDAFAMVDSANITSDGQAITTSLLTTPGGYTFVNGEGRDVTDTTGSIGPLTNTQFTEVEYSFQATEDAITGHTYCFRLYDSATSSPLDFYSVYPEVTLGSTMGSSVIIGEAGTVTAPLDGGWTTINFVNQDTYTSPVIVGTTNASVGNNGTDVDNAVVFEARNVTLNSAEVRLCESDGDFADGCATHAAESTGYLVIDADATGNVPGLEAGTFSVSGRFNDTNVTTNYAESFSTTPQVFGAVQAASGTSPIDFRALTTSATSFTAGICEPGATDDICEATHGTELVGWIAIEPGNEPFLEQSESGSINSVSGGGWASDTFATAFGAAPVMLAEIQGEAGGQDHEIDEVRSVTTTGFDTRSCEIDGPDLCDAHGVDTIAWFAVESGALTASSSISFDQMNFRWYDNSNAVTPTNARAAENVIATTTLTNEQLRLRVDVQVGGDIATSSLSLKLQYAERVTTCSAVGAWIDVGTTTSGVVWRGHDNAAVADGATLSSSLLNGAGNVAQTYEENNPATRTVAFIADGDRGEWDFALDRNGINASITYCFRTVTDGGGELNYTRYAELYIGPQEPPVASAVVINNGSSTVILTESATTSVMCFGTVTDVNGSHEVATVTADIYRTSVGTSSALDDQNHYRLSGDSECIPSNTATTTEDYTCTFAFQYFADPTDAGSPYAAEEWTCTLLPFDAATGTAATDTIEVASLLALDVTSPIDYGTVDANVDTGATNQQITVSNTGNVDMDPELSGDPMVSGANSIVPGQQQYASTTFTYGAATTLNATTSPASINLTLPQPTSTATVSASLYWGIGVPGGTASGTYNGINYIDAILGL